MCFSATASFVTAGITGGVGIVALKRASGPKEWPLAAVPVVFAIQQCVEGLLWLQLPVAPDAETATILTYLFLLFAEVWWPVYAPMAALLVEPSKSRRLVMTFCLVAGICVAAYFLWRIFGNYHAALIVDGHVVYVTEQKIYAPIGIAYLIATGVPLVLSSHRAVVALGFIIMTGATVAYVLYWEAFVSVWCFFAAIASVAVLSHFEWAHRRRLHFVS